ncbi:MAG: LptF/LptG family permease [Candidatus Firestonebacteria bacterium]
MRSPVILYRYIAVRFLKNFAASLSALFLIFFIISISDEIRPLIESKISLWLMLKYFAYKIPYQLLYTAPFASLVGTLITLTGLNKTNEIMAMKTSGISTTKIISPILLLSFLLSLGALIANETFVTNLYAKSAKIRIRDIWKSVPSSAEVRNNLIFKSKDGWLAYIKLFNGERNLMSGITIFFLNPDSSVKRRIDSEKAEWKNNKWYFYNSYIRDFPNDKKETAEIIKISKALITESPEELASRKKHIDQLTVRELYQEIKELEMHGEKTGEERVFLHFKLSYAFSIFMLSFLALPFGLNTGKYTGVILSFAISFLIGFVYWQLLSLGKVLGMHGVVAPYIAAWSGNFIFLIVGGVMLLTLKK